MTRTTSDYLKTVRDIAAKAAAKHPGDTYLDSDHRSKYVSQSVDGSEYIIDYSANETVLEASDNEPNAAEVRAMSAARIPSQQHWAKTAGADWRTLRMLAAYLAMELDVLAEVKRLIAAKPMEG